MDLHSIIEVIDTGTNAVENGAGAVKYLSAAQAYRKYDWLRQVPLRNRSGNFRGMVISARWRTVYLVSSEVEDLASNVGLLISIADETQKSLGAARRILHSDDPWEIKGARLSLQVTGVCTRVLLGIPAGGVHALTWIGRHMAYVHPIYWLDPKGYYETLDEADRLVSHVTSAYEEFTVGDGLYHLIQTHVR